jgi:protein O-mannosyl-transferase
LLSINRLDVFILNAAAQSSSAETRRTQRKNQNVRGLAERDWIFGAVLLALTLSAYQPAWNGTALWDDDANITRPELRSPRGLLLIWAHLGATQQYYPLVHTVNWVEYHLWGDWTTGNHLLNILLHVFSALLLMRILRKLKVPGARLAAMIFALHPVMVESVAWITELKNTLSGVFFFGSALAFLTFSEERKRKFYVLSLALFILGLMSKTAIAPFPLAMLAVVWWKRGKLLWRRDVAPIIPFFMAGIAFGLITSYVERTFVSAEGQDFSFSVIERCLIAGRAVWFYLGKIFWPANLIFIYPRWQVDGGVWRQYLFPAAALALAAVLWTMRGRWRSPLAVFLYFTAMLLPVIGFFNVFAFRFSFVADHWQYCAAAGPIAMGAGLMDRALGSAKGRWRFLKPAVTVILLLALGALSWKQSGMYSDMETLYRTTLRKNPACWMAHNNLGLLLSHTGRTDEAIAHYLRALEINPGNGKAHYNLGIALADKGRTDEAVVHYRRALEINPHFDLAFFNLGRLLARTGRTDEAIACFQKALDINPDNIKFHYNLGNALFRAGQTDGAVAHYQKAYALARSTGQEALAREITAGLERLLEENRSLKEKPRQ